MMFLLMKWCSLVVVLVCRCVLKFLLVLVYSVLKLDR